MKPILSVVALCLLISVCCLKPNSKSQTSNLKPETERPGEAWDALQFFNTSRAFPNNDIPEDAYTKGYEQYKANFQNDNMRTRSGKPAIQTAAWQNIGPNNIGGRTIAIAFDPTDTAIIWLGSASGGLWKSTTGGTGTNAWTYIPTGFPVRGVSAIAINPTNKNEMYIGTGETYSYGTTVNGLVTRPTRGTAGIGILKTSDGGTTWTQTLNWNYNQTRGIWDIVMNPLNPTQVYAATTEGIYKTDDAGATWTQVLAQQMVMDLEIDPVDTARVYAGVGNAGSPNPGIYRTINSGAAWTRLTAGLPPATNQGRISLRINPMNHNTIFALIADLYSTVGLYKSQNKGNNWLLVNNSTDVVSYQGWYAKGLWIKSNDSTRMLLGGVDVFSGTSGGGNITDLSNNFNFYVHSDVHDIIGNPHNPSKVYVICDGGLFRTNNFGNSGITFYECTDGYVTTQHYIGSVSTTDPNMMLVGTQDNYTNQYTGSVYWNVNVTGGDGSFNAIDPQNDNNQYASSQYLNVYASTSRGVNGTWYGILSEPSSAYGGNPTAFVAPYILCPSNTSYIYAGGDSLFHSTDGGNTWIPRPGMVDSGNVILTIAVSSTNTDSIYFATAPDSVHSMRVFKSKNGGATLTDISGSLPNRYPRAIAVDPVNSKIVYIVFSGFGTGHVFKSINAGNTWTDIGGTLPDVPFHTVQLVPVVPEALFVGSDLGIFASLDAGGTWFAFNTGLPDGVLVFDLRYSPADNSLVAFTHGNGVYKTSLNNLATGLPSENSFVHQFTQKIISNPVHQQLSLLINAGTTGKATISIFDINGKLIKKLESCSLIQGRNTVEVDMSSAITGSYFVKTDFGKETMVNKFVLIEN